MEKQFGNNSHGYENEIDFVNELNKGINNINLNLKEFIKYICKNENIEYSNDLKIKAELEKNNDLKQDVYLYINNSKFYISLKVGSGNSVHQEKCEDFVEFIKLNYGASEEVCNLWRFFIWGDGTLDGSGSLEKNDEGRIKCRFSTQEFKKKYKTKRAKLQEFLLENEEMLLKHFLFIGRHNSNVDYIYHGSPENGRWISSKKVLEFQLENSNIGQNKACFYCGRMTLQIWNSSLKGTQEKKRGQLQLKFPSMKKDFEKIMSKESSNIGTFQGDLQEYSLTQLLNKNKNHEFWKYIIGNVENDNLYRVTVKGMKPSKLSNSKVHPKSDAFIIQTNEISKSYLLKKEYLITEKDLNNIKYDIIPNTGISIKLKDSKNYTIQKFTTESFMKAFNHYGINTLETLYALLVYSKPKDIHINKRIAEDLGVDYIKFIEKKRIEFNLLNDFDEKVLFEQIRKKAQEELYKIIKNNKEIKESIFKGKYWFDDPYYAEYIYSFEKLEKNNPNNKFHITTGSGRHKGKYSIIIKPKV